MNTETIVNELAEKLCSNETDYLMFIGYLAKCVNISDLEKYYGAEIQALKGNQ